MERVLFLCVHNSSRSQIAEAYLRKFGEDSFEAESAGLSPGLINPYVVRALSEEGIQIAGKPTKDVYALYKAGRRYDYVITLCDTSSAERCPSFPGVTEMLEWPFPDPSKFTGTDEDIMARIRVVRDAIKEHVLGFIDEHTDRDELN